MYKVDLKRHYTTKGICQKGIFFFSEGIVTFHRAQSIGSLCSWCRSKDAHHFGLETSGAFVK